MPDTISKATPIHHPSLNSVDNRKTRTAFDIRMKDEQQRALYRYRFGSAEFDEARFELTIGGLTVDVQRKPLEILAILLRHVDEVVTRDELLESVWEGRPTVEHVVANAIAKLRSALGEDNAARVITQPRVGYRLKGPLERIAVGRAFTSALNLRVGLAVPGRENFSLVCQLSQSNHSEVWLAQHNKTAEQRVYKFSPDGHQLAALKREATLYRVLRTSLGDRPDLVRVIDWNFEAAPYFLECAYGGPDLVVWASTEDRLASLPTNERLDLFLQIADAIAAAHSVGVLHKDLKPTNVMVESKPGGWQIRVGDFGSGRLLELDRLQALGITQLGLTMTQGVGADSASATPLYLAPELLSGHEPSAQSDVYALGLILYQLLNGDLRKPLVSGWERDIADELLREDIAKATDGDPALRLPTVAALTERLRALDQRRSERHQTALLEESAAHLRATVQRSRARRPWVIAAIASLAIGLSVASWLYLRELRTHRELLASELEARQQTQRAIEVTRFLKDNVLSSGDPFLGEAHQKRTIKEALDDAAASLQDRFPDDPMTEASIRMALATVYTRILESAEAETQWRRVVELLAREVPQNDARLVESRYWLAVALTLQAKLGEAKDMLTLADAGRSSDPSHDANLDLVAQRSWGTYFMDQQQCAKAIPYLEGAIRLLRSGHPVDQPSLDLSEITLGQCYTGQSRFKDSERLSAELLTDLQHRVMPSKLTMALALYVHGESLLYQERYNEAAPEIEEAYRVTLEKLGPLNLRTVMILNVRCNLYSMTDRREETLACLRQSYADTRQRYGNDNMFTWAVLVNVGAAQAELGRYREAVQALTDGHAGLVRTLGPDKGSTFYAAYHLARSLQKIGDNDQAAKLMQPLDAKILDEAEPGAPWDARLSLLRGEILLAQHHPADAVPLLRAAAGITSDKDPGGVIAREAKAALSTAGSM
jgi:non-specific serine/threonine protein kinase